jgi:hypothetical protein
MHNRCVDHRPPRAAVDPGAALWIASRLSGQFGAVTRTVPAGFAAYARIFHPADPGAAVHRRWSEVAAANGRIMHPLAQYARISTPAPGRTEPAPLAGMPRSPNISWSGDRSWCAASEIDFDSTIVGGTTDLIADILHRDDLEAWPVGPDDSLAWDGDTINQP